MQSMGDSAEVISGGRSREISPFFAIFRRSSLKLVCTSELGFTAASQRTTDATGALILHDRLDL